jgi:ATP-dependent Clp protease ATP-binding subunit ClpA
MTSNIGARDMSSQNIGFGQEKATNRAQKGVKAAEKHFSPEFRNRLDGIVPFNALSPELMERIVDKSVTELNEQLREKKVKVELTPAATAWVARKGFDPDYGARPLSRVVQSEIKDRLADELLFGSLQKGGTVTVDTAKDEEGEEALAFSYS